MNATQPPVGDRPTTSALAIWSLVLGILSLICFSIFTAIPGVICGHKALSRIKRSQGALAGDGLALAGLITSYLGIAMAVVVIPMMVAIAVPNFVKARETALTNVCKNNLRQIAAAKEEWALENKKEGDDTPTEGDLTPFLKDGQVLKCPAGGVYQLNSVGSLPTCSKENHTLQE